MLFKHTRHDRQGAAGRFVRRLSSGPPEGLLRRLLRFTEEGLHMIRQSERISGPYQDNKTMIFTYGFKIQHIGWWKLALNHEESCIEKFSLYSPPPVR